MKTPFGIVATLAAMGVLVGCQSQATTPQEQGQEQGQEQFKVALLIPGNLGDMSFFDAANAGLTLAESQLGAQVQVVEMGTDATTYMTHFQEACHQDWDLIVTGSATVVDPLHQCAQDYPEQLFVNYDAIDDSTYPNVYSVAYGANQSSYLSGVLAGLATVSEALEDTNEEGKIGFIGGTDTPQINDFLVGYTQGAQSVNPQVNLSISYVGSFSDPATAKDLALNQYSQGVDIIYCAAGGSGLGVLDAAQEAGGYAIGVDVDQAALFEEDAPEKANRILTSAIKCIDQTVYKAIQAAMEGTLALGTHEVLGIEQGGVALAKNHIYTTTVPAQIQTAVDQAEAALLAGDVQVASTLDVGA